MPSPVQSPQPARPGPAAASTPRADWALAGAHVAVVADGEAAPPVVRRLIETNGPMKLVIVRTADLGEPAGDHAVARSDVMLACESTADLGTPPGDNPALEAVREAAEEHGVGVVLLTDRPEAHARDDETFVCLPRATSLDVLRGALAAMAQSRGMMKRLTKELGAMRRLGANLHRHFEDVDRELRLASRLQRDFLPREMPDTGPLRFATVYRPCSWVSGDIYDVMRLDEHHVGFYLADAVGHGVAAGLLTIYLKNAIRPKRIYAGGYELLSPATVMEALNEQLVAQQLADSQFLTAWYGIINTQTLELRYANAGHPPPLLIVADDGITELHGDGCILGITSGQAFSDERVQLATGDRLLLYSDGIESVLIEQRSPMPNLPRLKTGIPELLRKPTRTFIAGMMDRMESEVGSLYPDDDVSFVVMDVGPQQADTDQQDAAASWRAV